MVNLSEAVVVDFPLRGEWAALNTPAERVPSHGTDYFGQRFAFDFIQLDWTTRRPHRGRGWRHLLATLPAQAFLCWDQPVYAAFEGHVMDLGDGWRDRDRINGLWELLRATVLVPAPVVMRAGGRRDYRPLTGNFVLVKGDVGVALYAHLRQGTVRVRVGDRVGPGTELGRVGNSGNSTMPHLHFHLMDQADPYRASGRLCAFRALERFVGGRWELLSPAIPARLDRVRAV